MAQKLLDELSTEPLAIGNVPLRGRASIGAATLDPETPVSPPIRS